MLNELIKKSNNIIKTMLLPNNQSNKYFNQKKKLKLVVSLKKNPKQPQQD
jgi:hypothetical protein